MNGVNALHVLCEGSSMHAVIPFGDDDTDTSKTPETVDRCLADTTQATTPARS